jgi:phosphatidylinositol 4-kinase A
MRPHPHAITAQGLVRRAWRVTPRLALMLGVRFPFEAVQSEIAARVRTEPHVAVDLPEAVGYLITRKNVEADIAELKHLVYWAPSTPATAVQYLGGGLGKHPIVAQYAVRSLSACNPDDVIFYVPQLVQVPSTACRTTPNPYTLLAVLAVH